MEIEMELLRIENRMLREQICALAMEHSSLLEIVKKNEYVLKRRQFYHDNKENIKKEMMKNGCEVPKWHLVKKRADELFWASLNS